MVVERQGLAPDRGARPRGRSPGSRSPPSPRRRGRRVAGSPSLERTPVGPIRHPDARHAEPLDALQRECRRAGHQADLLLQRQPRDQVARPRLEWGGRVEISRPVRDLGHGPSPSRKIAHTGPIGARTPARPRGDPRARAGNSARGPVVLRADLGRRDCSDPAHARRVELGERRRGRACAGCDAGLRRAAGRPEPGRSDRSVARSRAQRGARGDHLARRARRAGGGGDRQRFCGRPRPRRHQPAHGAGRGAGRPDRDLRHSRARRRRPGAARVRQADLGGRRPGAARRAEPALAADDHRRHPAGQGSDGACAGLSGRHRRGAQAAADRDPAPAGALRDAGLDRALLSRRARRRTDRHHLPHRADQPRQLGRPADRRLRPGDRGQHLGRRRADGRRRPV